MNSSTYCIFAVLFITGQEIYLDLDESQMENTNRESNITLQSGISNGFNGAQNDLSNNESLENLDNRPNDRSSVGSSHYTEPNPCLPTNRNGLPDNMTNRPSEQTSLGSGHYTERGPYSPSNSNNSQTHSYISMYGNGEGRSFGQSHNYADDNGGYMRPIN